MISELKITTPDGAQVSAICQDPGAASAIFVIGHGSGSTIRVPLMETLAGELANLGIMTLRFGYPYSDSPDFIPFSDIPVDKDSILIDTACAAVSKAREIAPGLRLLAGGHSLSALIISQAAAAGKLSADAFISLGFPAKNDPARSAHLGDLNIPALFIQGTDDTLGAADELRQIKNLAGGVTNLMFLEGVNHGFKSEDRSQQDILREAARAIAHYLRQLT